MLGVRQRERTVFDFLPRAFHKTVGDCFAEVAATGKPGSYEHQYHAETGEARIFDSRVGPVFKAAEVVALTVNSTDITERRQLNARILKAQKLESLSILAGGIAHDFNKPRRGQAHRLRNAAASRSKGGEV